jgi:ADP-ribose pyrophosphatase
MTREQVKTLLDTPFLRVYDLQYAEGRHYYNASRRDIDRLTAVKTAEEFRTMLPDAVTCIVIIRTPGEEPRLMLMREYRYPAGRMLTSPPAGLVDPADQEQENPLFVAAKREIREEAGIGSEPSRMEIVNSLLFSSPGMTDESNALVLAVYDLPDLSELNQDGAEGSELFDGFILLTRKEAEKMLRKGSDEGGVFYSVYTWTALTWFVSGLWEE